MADNRLAAPALGIDGDRLIMVPADPGFHEILASTPPPDWRIVAEKSGGEFQYVVRYGGATLEAVPYQQTIDYLYGGEWDDRMGELPTDDDEDEPEGWLLSGDL